VTTEALRTFSPSRMFLRWTNATNMPNTAPATTTMSLRAAWPVLLLLGLSACAPEETLRYGPVTVDLRAEGPLFEGPNTAQATVDPGIAAFLQVNGATPEQLRKATLVSARLSSQDSIGLANVGGMSLQVMSEGASAQELGVRNPLPPGATVAELELAHAQDGLAGHLRQTLVTWVADLQLKADEEDDRHIRAELTFELTLER